MVNINAIKTIEDAKKAEYNGKKLTESEKSIFDSKLLTKKIGEKADLEKVHDATLLLDKVKQAMEVDLTDGFKKVKDLLNALENAKNSKSNAYEVVNSYNEQ